MGRSPHKSIYKLYVLFFWAHLETYIGLLPPPVVHEPREVLEPSTEVREGLNLR